METFETTPINIGVSSVDGTVSMNVDAYTADRVTGNMSVIDWNTYVGKWRHLDGIEFPEIASRNIVDILIGLYCAELHYALKEIRGRPGEPVARLTPLGWTCIGNPEASKKYSSADKFPHAPTL